MKLQTIIVNYRTPELVVDCLRSLAGQIRDVAGGEVVVVEGGSGDASAAVLAEAIQREGWQSWAHLVVSQENRGFAGANNVALRRALAGGQEAEYLWLLNPDTVARPGAMAGLVEFMDEHPRAAVAGSRLENVDGTAQCAAFRFPTLLGELEGAIRMGAVTKLLKKWMVAPRPAEEAQQVDWVSGASFMIRTAALRQVGLLDEHYFMFFEELDFCRRAAMAGWECWTVPGSRVVHLGGQATGLGNGQAPQKRMPPYWFASRRRYLLKHHGMLYALAANLIWVVGRGLWSVGRLIRRKPRQDPPWLWWDFVRFNLVPGGYGRNS